MWSRPSIPQTDPPRPAKETLPTMYDLPSEDPEEPGLPDEFHDLQPQLLSRTLRLRDYAADRLFTGTDLNLYYDVRHPSWHKRPDWFLVLGVPRLYEQTDLRSSYVIWQEGVNPFVVVELLSPGTEQEDLGENAELSVDLEADTDQAEEDDPEETDHSEETPPRKWDVYEKILRIPYYVIFSRYTNQVRFFKLTGGHYQEQAVDSTNPRLWIEELNVGLGLWHGEFEGITRSWLRWYARSGNWIPTDTERFEQEQHRADRAEAQLNQEQDRADRAEAQLAQVALNLLQTGMTIAEVAGITGLSEDQIRQIPEP